MNAKLIDGVAVSRECQTWLPTHPTRLACIALWLYYVKRRSAIYSCLGRFCDFRIVDNALQNAARIAREIARYHLQDITKMSNSFTLGGKRDELASSCHNSHRIIRKNNARSQSLSNA